MKFPVSSPFPTPILILDRVSKRFAGHIAVDELSLSVPRGVIYGLLGPNGAGKTTTIRMIMDILEPDGGAVRIFGEPGGGRAHSGRIGYLPEERGLYRKMRVLDVLVFLGEMKGIDRRRASSRHRVRRESRRSGAGLRRQHPREQGGRLRSVCRARARVGRRPPADPPAPRDVGRAVVQVRAARGVVE